MAPADTQAAAASVLHERIFVVDSNQNLVKRVKTQSEVEYVLNEEDQYQPLPPHPSEQELSKTVLAPLRIRWPALIAQLILHLAGIYGCSYFPTARWSTIIFTNVLTLLGAVGVINGAHRFWSHRSYKANLGVRLFLLFCFYLACNGDIIFWVRAHRAHHKWAETDADPHNVRRGFFFSHIGWLMVHRPAEFRRKAATLDLTDLLSDPLIRFQRRYHFLLLIPIWILFPVATIHYLFGESWLLAFTFGVGFRYILLNNIIWSANSFAHLYGERPYQKKIGAAEVSYIRHMLFGDGTHNYHHAFPWDYSSSELGIRHMFNPASAIIETWAALGWAWDLKKVDPALIRKRMERSGDPGFRYPTDTFDGVREWAAGLSFFGLPIWLALASRAMMAAIGYVMN